MQPTVFELPTYIENGDQSNYNAEMNQTLRQMLSSTGWLLPDVTTSQATELATSAQDGTIWFNTTVGLPQVVIGNVIKTFTVT